MIADGRSLVRQPGARQQQLIAFLVLQGRDTPVQRQRVGGSLWPESTDVQALTNLRRELHHLREGWPALDALVDVGSRTLSWRGEALVDLIAFEASADRGLAGDRAALDGAARLYKGDLLPDCTAEWIDADRERLRQRARNVLTRLVGLLEHDRAFGDAIEHAQHLLRFDPLDEEAWCALMRCHARRGDRATALHLYQQCAAMLKKELGIQPSAKTRLTYREILDLDPDTVAAVPAPPRSVAYPLVGRRTEWQTLLGAWRAAAAGRPQLFLIRGEAGIGKSRLAEELVDWCGIENIVAVTARCYAGEGRLAYAPVAAWLKSDALRPTLTRLDAPWMTHVARLCPEVLARRSEIPPPDAQLESWQRQAFFEALSQAFRSAAPLVLVLDDLQWADGDTIEWLHYFLRSVTDTHCLVVGTVRTEEEQDNPPLGRMLGRLERDNMLTAIALGPLDQSASARLALLSENARAAAEVAAAVGRDFRFDILAQASDLEEDALVHALDELWRRHIVRVQEVDGANILIGWARGQQRPAQGIEIIEPALDRLDRKRAQARRPYSLSLLAETYDRLGSRDRATSILDAAVTMALDRGEAWWLPALYLQKGEIDAPGRQEAFRHALELVRAQHSRGLERRIRASPSASST